jgi:lipopolysaccharide export system permease protein
MGQSHCRAPAISGPDMPRLSFYVLRQLIGPVALFTFLLTSVIWLSQSLRLLDLVINRGQSAPIFLYLTVLILPRLLVYILPMAFFAGTLFGLNKLNADSELVVMSAAGFSRRQLAAPVIMAAVIMMVLTYLCSLYLMPLGERAMKSKVLDIRSDIGTAILNEGEFNTPTNDLTVFIRSLAPDGNIRGILVHDNRDTLRPTTYIAESGILADTPAGARLIMFDGTIEQSSLGGSHLSVLRFKQYIFDLDQFAGPQQAAQLETSERFLPELFWPGPHVDTRVRNAYFAEANNRLAAPLYCIAFAFIAFAAVTRGRGGRGAYALRLTMACAFAGIIRIIGYGAQGAAARNPALCTLLYLIPLAGAGIALLDIAGFDPGTLFGRFWQTPLAEPAR